MINTNDVNRITNIFSDLFFYGLSRGYSYSAIEERIAKSDIVRDLENGDAYFLNQKNPEDIAKEIYNIPEKIDYLMESNALAMWLGDIYTKLFFRKNKSLSYLFLYFPLENAIDAFDLYHEIDVTQLLKRFDEIEKDNTILSLLLKKKGLKARELSALTRININTVVSYKRSNENVYNAKYQHIYQISSVLKVNPNIFVERINNYTNSQMYDFDKDNPTYRLYLAYYLACYYDKEIAETKYKQVNNTLVNGDNVFAVIWTNPPKEGLYTPNDNKEIELLVKEFKNGHQNSEKTILVVFEFSQISDETNYYLPIRKYGFKKVIVINQLYCFILSQDKYLRREITDTINEACIRNAKEKVSGDFAV